MRLEEAKVFGEEASAPLKLLKPALQRACISDDSDISISAKDGNAMLEPFTRADSQSTTTDEEPPESPSLVVKPAPFKKTDSNNSLFSST
jgi:hypothetical protein